MADSSHGNGGVQRGQHRRPQVRREVDGHVVQGVVVDDVEVVVTLLDQPVHQVQIGVLIGLPHRPRRRRGPAGGGATGQGADRQAGKVGPHVGVCRGEERYPMALLGQRARQVPDVGLQASGERLTDGEPIVCDEGDVQS